MTLADEVNAIGSLKFVGAPGFVVAEKGRDTVEKRFIRGVLK